MMGGICYSDFKRDGRDVTFTQTTKGNEIMLKRLFGETEEEQIHYLKPRVIITAVFFIVDMILLFVAGGIGLTVISCYIWGWGTMKALFGVTVAASLLGRNVVLVAIFIVAYLLIGYLCGIVTMLLGVGQFIYLEVKRRKVG